MVTMEIVHTNSFDADHQSYNQSLCVSTAGFFRTEIKCSQKIRNENLPDTMGNDLLSAM